MFAIIEVPVFVNDPAFVIVFAPEPVNVPSPVIFNAPLTFNVTPFNVTVFPFKSNITVFDFVTVDAIVSVLSTNTFIVFPLVTFAIADARVI